MQRWFKLLVSGLVLAGCAADVGDGLDDQSPDAVRVCGSGEMVEGVDVSFYQGTVDWARVRASGRRFAFLRVSDGTRYPDDRFADNWRGARAAGLLRGAYQFFRPGQDARAQADLMINAIGTLGPGDLPPVIDVEASDGQSDATIVRNVRTWIQRVREATGREPIIYAASGFWNTISGTSEFSRQLLWVANYGVRCPDLPSTWTRWTFWQYSESGSVPGIAGGADVNVFNGSYAQLQALANVGSTPAPRAEDLYCTTGFTYETSSRLCVSATEAVGPFTNAMIDACIRSGGGDSACRGNRWNAAFARGIRGTDPCPPGATVDARSGYCTEGDNAFGPFSRTLVEACRANGGSDACESNRWARGFVTSTSEMRYCPSGTRYESTSRLCVSDTEAVGPFTQAMIARCVSSGGGMEACNSDRWNVGFARSIRGNSQCPPGSTLDSTSGYCIEGDNAFGPFTVELVARCRAIGGAGACETMRWARSFVGATGSGRTEGNPLTVPYFYQYANANEPGGTCGLTSASMVLNFWGQNVTPDGLYVRYGKPQGQSPPGLEQLYRWHGLVGRHTYNGSFAMIRRNIDAGRPVIVHGNFTRAGHIMVVIGYSDSGFIVNDPAGRWRGCVGCGYGGSSTATNGRGTEYSYEAFRAAVGDDGDVWLSAAGRSDFSL